MGAAVAQPRGGIRGARLPACRRGRHPASLGAPAMARGHRALPCPCHNRCPYNYEDFLPTPGLPAAVQARAHDLVAAGERCDGHDRRTALPHRPRCRRAAVRRQHAQQHELAARDHDQHTLLLLALAILGSVLVRWVLTYWRRMIAGRVSLGIEYDLRERLYGHLQRLELGFFDHQQTGQLMSRATVDLQAVRFFLGYGLVFILQSAFDARSRRRGDDRDQPRPRPDRDGAGARSWSSSPSATAAAPARRSRRSSSESPS